MKIATRVPLDQLRPPESDVREHRPEKQVAGIAQSMGDPSVGQLQPVLAYPAGWDDLDLEDQDDLRQVVRDGHDIVVLDGETRRQAAADFLGWHDIWCWIWDEPPENPTVAQLDANTERIDMTSFETVRAIVDHKDDSGRTWQEIAEDVGYDPSTLSKYASVLRGPEWIVEPLRDPDHPLEVGHAREIYAVTGQKITDAFCEVGALEEDKARRKQAKLGRHLVGWAAEYGWTVTETRQAVERKVNEVLDELEHGGGARERQRQAEKDAAASLHGAPVNQDQDDDECIVCGRRATTKIAIDVCDEDRGLLTDHQAKGEPLMSPQEPQEDPQELLEDLDGVSIEDLPEPILEALRDAQELQANAD